MANQSRKRRGRETEHIVTARLKRVWEGAYVVNSGASGSDCLGVPFFVEVKARKDFKPKEVLDSIKKRTNGQLGFAVMRLANQGEQSVDDFAAVIRFGDLIELLERYYQQKISTGVDRCQSCGSWIVEQGVCRTCTILESRYRQIK